MDVFQFDLSPERVLSKYNKDLIFFDISVTVRSIGNCFYFSSVGTYGLQDIIKSHKTKYLK